EELVLGHARVQQKRGERRAIDLLEDRTAQRRLAGADVAGDDDEALAAPDRVLQKVERVAVRLAAIEELRIRRQAERLLRESVIVFVHQRVPVPVTMVGVRRTT